MPQRRNDRQHEAWMRQESARVAREQERIRKAEEQKRKAEERQRQEDYVRQQQESAQERTSAAEERSDELTGVLSAALAEPVGPLDFESMKSKPSVPELDLGFDEHPAFPPRWEQFAPEPPSTMSRLFGGQARYEREKEIARNSFDAALERHNKDEISRQQRVTQARKQHAAKVESERNRVADQNNAIEAFRRKVQEHDRHAVSTYFEQVLKTVKDPADFPETRRAAYDPESAFLLIEWQLPSTKIVPTAKEFGYVKSRDVIEVRKSRPLAEVRQLYNTMACQVALRALHVAFHAAPDDLLTTIVFNGVVEATDPVTGHEIRPHLITLRATRERFDGVKLDGVDPIKCVRQHFAAEVSPHPDELTAVEPMLTFNMVDPRIVDPIDVISDIDKRPNLLELTHKEFEDFIQNLFTRMGFETKRFKDSGDGGIDCVAYDPTPIRGGKYIIQVKHYTKTVPPTAIRDLWGVVQHEGATKGILITTSGFGPGTYQFANNKPLQLFTGTQLLALCHAHNIPVRILRPTKSRNKST